MELVHWKMQLTIFLLTTSTKELLSPEMNLNLVFRFSPIVTGGEFWSASDIVKETEMYNDFEDGDSRDFNESRCEIKKVNMEIKTWLK